MKHQWLAYVTVGLLSIGAGVAIAGLPDNVPVDATIIPPTTTEASETTVPSTTATTTTATTVTVPETTEPDTTEPDTTEPDTTQPDTTRPDDSVQVESGERGDMAVAVANGANVAGAASNLGARLEQLGYVDVASLNGSDIFEFTVVYYADGFELAALRMAEDLALLPDFIAPLDDAPSVGALPAGTELLVYLGRDRA